VGGLTPSFTYDARDNLFTPTRGAFVEAVVGVFSPALGGDDAFQRVQLTAMQFVPLVRTLYLGVRRGRRGDLRRRALLSAAVHQPARRADHAGEEMAQIETELRWQFWKRFSVVGFAGVGGVWNDFERFHNTRTIPTGGFGFRYELARRYGIHMGFDIAFGPDNTAVYVQVGSTWAPP